MDSFPAFLHRRKVMGVTFQRDASSEGVRNLVVVSCFMAPLIFAHSILCHTEQHAFISLMKVRYQRFVRLADTFLSSLYSKPADLKCFLTVDSFAS